MPPRRRQQGPPTLPRRGRAAAAAAGVTAIVALLVAGPASRAAEPCTISWDGGAGTTRWVDDANWTGDRQPGADDLACIGAGAEVSFSIADTTLAGLRVDGSLTVAANDLTISDSRESEVTGTLTLAGGRLAIDADMTVASFRHSGGRLFGGGRVATPDFHWTGGSEHGAGATQVLPGGSGLEIGGGGHTLDQTRTLRIEPGATATWTAGDIELNDRARLQNAGLLDIRGDQDLIGCCGVTPEVVNEAGGTLRKSAGGDVTRLTYPMVNDGELDVEAGTMSIEGGSAPGRSSAGSFDVEDGATLLFPSGTTALGPTSSVTARGAGQLRFTGGDTHFAGVVDAPVVVDGTVARAFFESPVSLPRIRLVRGFLHGAGTVTTTDLEWTGGTQVGAGTTRIASGGPGLRVAGDARHVLDGRRLEVSPGAVATWTAGRLTMLGTATLENAGLFDVAGDLELDVSCCDLRSLVHNAAGGTFRKNVGGGRARVAVGFRNDGTLEAASGTLDLAGGLANLAGNTLDGGEYLVSATLAVGDARVVRNAAKVFLDGPASRIEESAGADALRDLQANEDGGSLTLANGAALAPAGELANAGSVVLADAARLAPAGAYTQSSGSTTFAAPDAVLAPGAGADLAGGDLQGAGTVEGDLVSGATVAPGLVPGVLTVAGDYTQTAGGTFLATIARPGLGSRLDVAGRATLGGTLRLDTITHQPDPSDEIELIRHGSEEGEFDHVDGLEPQPGHSWSPPDYDPAGVWLRPGIVPAASIGDATVSERGPTATLEVRVDPTPTRTVRVEWSTVDGTARAPGDYAPAGGTVRIPHGHASGEIEVPVVADTADEANERFDVELSSPVNAYLSDHVGTAMILDDDEPAKPPPGGGPGTPKPPRPPGRPGPTPRPPGAGPPGCVDHRKPMSRIRVVKRRNRRLRARGRARDRGCARLKRVQIAIAKKKKGRCRYVKKNGRLGKKKPCKRAKWLRVKGKRKWHFRAKRRLPKGRYRVRTRATDKLANREKKHRRRNTRTFRLR